MKKWTNQTIEEVITAFLDGRSAKSASGSLESIRHSATRHLLVDFGEIVIAENWNGQYYIYSGWDGHSYTVTKHLGLIKEAAGRVAGAQGVCITDDSQPRLTTFWAALNTSSY